MVRRPGCAGQLAVALLLCAFAAHTASAQGTPLPGKGAGSKPAATQKKNPLAKLGEAWPDAEGMRERRTAAENQPLFKNAEPLAFTLRADFKAVNRDRDPDSTKRFPGTLTVNRDGAPAAALSVQLSTRGHFRLRSTVCSFVPLRIDFPKDETRGTIFDGQKALKLTTHCQGDAEYAQYPLREYLAYQIFGLFTPRSFRARLAKATYVDATSDKTIATRYAVFVEDDDDVARRMDGRIAALQRVLFNDLDRDSLTLMMLIQYMVANTDFSIYKLHNIRLVQDQARVLFPVTYDFDLSGLVNTRYAIPDRLLGIKTVRERVYRGPCRTLEELEPFVATILAKKSEVMALYESLPDLDREYRRGAKEFLDEFYSGVSRPGGVKRRFVDGCSPKPTM